MTSFVGIDVTQTYSAAQLTGANSGKAPKVGDLYESYDSKSYRFVKYNQGAGAIAAVANNVVGFYAPGGTSTGVWNEVTSDVSDTAANGAGVLAGAPGNGEYGWIQVKGPATLNTALVSGASGQALALSVTTDGTLKVAAAVTETVCAYCILASAKIIMCAFPH
ncbi:MULTISPECIES: hypothetical protein [unclassified Mesorhizobium]|uniref:hypothetical protein n=1 Tax=unclassified Mesorhizobium TaxID=325217 RepID=UPI0010935D17|nr:MULTISPECIES: hypothetical protein [unclassified Mesorhizobium]TGS47533.1 hypothetical protein EN825_00750 [Mesorhizobium sp. M8A.F.Ca.ET.182.01.1.1]TGS84177.1 hypothetical protein EN824_07375 [Mesorhizobium sp. M8A.F.Ca.ET.181.01.1.1]TGT34976.1 hypothetical protein EN808_34880 [Mesorhizobium sp. M8A.F.Ca.ET.165.01.1.1]